MASALIQRTEGSVTEVAPRPSLGGEYILNLDTIPVTLGGMLGWAHINNRHSIERDFSGVVLSRPGAPPRRIIDVFAVPLRAGDPFGPDSEQRNPSTAGAQVREWALISDTQRLLSGLGLKALVMQEVVAACNALAPIIVSNQSIDNNSESLVLPVEFHSGEVRLFALNPSVNLRYLNLLDSRRTRLRVSDRIAGLLRP